MKKKIRYIFFIGVMILSTLCYYEIKTSYKDLNLSNYIVNTKKINNGINFVIISDLHDNEIGENNKELVDKIMNQSPDAILVVGDMINNNSKDSDIVINFMKQLSKNARVFYSLGNSEEDYIKAGNSDLIKELENIDVTVLDNEYEDLKIKNTTIRIGGMYDYAFGLDKYNSDTYDFLSEFQYTDNYKIMMAHRPDSFIFGDASIIWDIDLVVSGHTHGGQVVFPFLGGLYVGDQGWFPKYTKGLYDLNRMRVIITSGLGSNKQKLPRFNNPPEIVDLELNNK